MEPDRNKRTPVMSDIVYGLAPAASLDGAVAWLIRDPDASPSLLVVLPREKVTGGLYAAARHLMYRDVQSQAATSGRRIVRLFSDQHVQIEEEGVSRRTHVRMTITAPNAAVAPELLRRHDGARKIHVEGIGLVSVVHDPEDPAHRV
ncbi:MAG: hypothetical protein JWN53_2109 [Gemmatimonadetes bacterium]|nr:hypothetical protein [Gemmatimonadota bacterium]